LIAGIFGFRTIIWPVSWFTWAIAEIGGMIAGFFGEMQRRPDAREEDKSGQFTTIHFSRIFCWTSESVSALACI